MASQSQAGKPIHHRGVDMFARKVAARLKPNALSEFTKVMEREILPWLRTQEGFLDLITLAAPDSSEIAAISFWDHEGNAHAYNSIGYPEVLKILGKLLDGTPSVRTFQVVGPTFRKLALARPRETETPAPETGSAQTGSAQAGSAQIGYRSYETRV
jgi:hypothetical protein